MERLLREVPVTDGLNVDILLQFLRKVIELRNHFHWSDRDLFEIIYSRCSEPLSAQVNLALTRQFTFEQFH
jgi:hypothetical protein